MNPMEDPTELGTLKRRHAMTMNSLPWFLKPAARMPDQQGRLVAKVIIAVLLPVVITLQIIEGVGQAIKDAFLDAFEALEGTIHAFGQVRALRKAIADEEARLREDA